MEKLGIEIKSPILLTNKKTTTDFDINGKKFEIYNEVVFGDVELSDNVETNVILSLLPYMKETVEEVKVSDAISEKFVKNLQTIQEIYNSWDKTFKPIQLQCTNIVKRENKAKRIGTFFTGGVDSFYTLLKNKDEITDVIFVHGLDIKLEDKELRDKVSSRIRAIAAELNVNVIELESNVRELINSYLKWGEYGHGNALASMGHLLSGHFKKIFIPASWHYNDLFGPWGTHPLLDYLWSTESLEFVHDGCEATRVKKVELIANYDVALKNLRVCYKNPNSEYNCGKCEKCIRTMINLKVNNALHKTSVFNHDLDLKQLSKFNLQHDASRNFVNENLDAIEEKGGNLELKKALQKSLKDSFFYSLKRFLKSSIKRNLSTKAFSKLKQLYYSTKK